VKRKVFLIQNLSRGLPRITPEQENLLDIPGAALSSLENLAKNLNRRQVFENKQFFVRNLRSRDSTKTRIF
jgi:hypothetical protein